MRARRQEMAGDRIRNSAFPGRHNPLLRSSVAGALRTVGAVLLETVAAPFPEVARGNLGSGACHSPNVEADAFVFAPVFDCVFSDALDAHLQRIEGGFLRFVSRWPVLTCTHYALARHGG